MSQLKLILCVCILSVSARASVESCQRVFVGPSADTVVAAPQTKKNLNHFEQIFTRTRGLGGYQLALGSHFTAALKRLRTTGGHWLDAGAGDAVAVQELLQESQDRQTTATVISLDCQVKSSDRLEVHSGRFIEEIPQEEISKSDIITDVFGPLAYSGHPHLILKKYLESLKPTGEIFIFLGLRDDIYGRLNRVITRDGRYLTLVEWLQQLPGVKTELLIESRDDDGTPIEKWSLRITRQPGVELDIHDVTLTDFEPGAPPRMLFQEKLPTPEAHLPLQQDLKAKIATSIASQMEQMTFTRFMDSFRGGEITHPLVSSIKNLDPVESWVNISEFGANLQNEFMNKAYDASNTTVFWGLAQKWIRFRINRINPDKFLYSNLKSSEAIGTIHRLGLITDFYGDFISQLQPAQVLQKYLNAVDPDGAVYLYLGKEYTGYGATTEVITKSGQRLPLRAWLQTIDGIKASLYRGGYAYTGGQWTFVKILKTKDRIHVPRLQFLAAEPNSTQDIPRMVFREY